MAFDLMFKNEVNYILNTSTFFGSYFIIEHIQDWNFRMKIWVKFRKLFRVEDVERKTLTFVQYRSYFISVDAALFVFFVSFKKTLE